MPSLTPRKRLSVLLRRYKKFIVPILCFFSLLSFTVVRRNKSTASLTIQQDIPPIDLVYTWVNGSDPQWLIEKERYQEGADHEVSDPSRFFDNQELRYSIRSVMMNAPWFHKIFIITNGQIPSWLDKSNPKIRIVTHPEIMPSDSLPTFNSEAIEANIGSIPDLSELFVYSNDDFFIYKPISPHFFFTSDWKPYVVPGKALKNMRRNMHFWNVQYSAGLIQERFKTNFTHEVVHNMRGFRKTDFVECMREFPDEFQRTTHYKFRTNESVQYGIHSYYALAKNKAVYSPSLYNQFVFLRLHSPFVMRLSILALTILRFTQPRLLCINDGPTVLAFNRRHLQSFLASLFPYPSPMELPSTVLNR